MYLSMSKLSILVKFFISKPWLIIPLTVIPTLAPVVVSIKLVSYILFWLFIADLISGITASYFTWKEKKIKEDRWFFGNGEGFNSDKAKKCFVKLIIYTATPFCLLNFQRAFLMKNIKIASITDAEIDHATAIIAVFCLIELFSIFHENLPKCGFNIFRIVKKMFGVYKEFKSEIKE